MVFNPVQDNKEIPHNTVVDSYTVADRSGAENRLLIRYSQVMRVMEDPVTITVAADVDSDGKWEQITVPEWFDSTDLVGRLVYLGEEEIGEISAWDNTTTTATIALGFATDPTGEDVHVQTMNNVNAPQYRLAAGHRSQESHITMSTPEAIQYIKELMFGAYFGAAKSLLAALGDAVYTDVDIQTALLALGAKGISIDSFMAEQGEKIEIDRRAGTSPFIQTMP